MDILNKLKAPEDVRNLSPEDTRKLCEEIREFLVESVSKTGGHLASNLGIVELTIALHRVYDTEKDRIVFDVGHQSYVHKLLTGRMDKFPTLRKYGGMAGFPKPNESVHDAFIGGHASDSVSVALGMARARTLKNESYNIAAVIGDGALTGGLAYEGLSDAGDSGEPLVVILNDNGMSITKNVGGMAGYLSRQRTKPGYFRLKKAYGKFCGTVPGGKALYNCTHKIKGRFKNMLLGCTMFEDMGFTYLGPVDGHDVEKLTYLLSYAKELAQPVLLHVITTKGHGYKYAEESPDAFHGIGAFNAENGEAISRSKGFSDVFGEAMVSLAKQKSELCAITAAMKTGTGLSEFAEAYPDRFFDVGIAEGHGVSMAAGMAKQGMTPVFAVYSTFLQRSYDMLIHDVAILGLHVVLTVDRAGLVGDDGETHHGVFDVGFLRQVPGMKIYCPASFSELEGMLTSAVLSDTGPVAVRYPRGGEGEYTGDCGSSDVSLLRTGERVLLIAYGTMINETIKAADMLEERGISAGILKLNCIAPLNTKMLTEAASPYAAMVMAEEAMEGSTLAPALLTELEKAGLHPKTAFLSLGKTFVQHGRVPELRHERGIDAEAIAGAAESLLGGIAGGR